MFFRIIIFFCIISCRNAAPQEKIETINSEVKDSVIDAIEEFKDTLVSEVIKPKDTLLNEKPSSTPSVSTNTKSSNTDKIIEKAKISPKKQSVEPKSVESPKEDKVIVSSPVVTPKVEASTDKQVKEVPENTENPIASPKTEMHPTHQIFQQQLAKYVSKSGKVNYAAWKKDSESLNQYLEELSNANINDTWSKNEQLAYWINVYNAFTIKLILDHYPVKSITDIKKGKPWDFKLININGKSYSLNDIEKDKIIKRFGEPRIHFAVNCAAKSCPPLSNVAYTKDNLQALLESNTTAFINSQHNLIEKNKVQLSKIFEWYQVDFGNDILGFVSKYSTVKPNPSTKISFLEYDWSLNE